MKVIGLTGGAGSGKSYVSQCIQSVFHLPVIDSDTVAKELMKPGEEAYIQVVNCFGNEILNGDATINRAKLAEIVFSDEEKLAMLNAATHPVTIAKIESMIRAYEKEEYPIVFVESALAEKAGYREFCDELWLVDASETIRAERLRTTRGYSDEKISGIFANQSTHEEMRKTCSRVIWNEQESDMKLLAQIGQYITAVMDDNYDESDCDCSFPDVMV